MIKMQQTPYKQIRQFYKSTTLRSYPLANYIEGIQRLTLLTKDDKRLYLLSDLHEIGHCPDSYTNVVSVVNYLIGLLNAQTDAVLYLESNLLELDRIPVLDRTQHHELHRLIVRVNYSPQVVHADTFRQNTTGLLLQRLIYEYVTEKNIDRYQFSEEFNRFVQSGDIQREITHPPFEVPESMYDVQQQLLSMLDRVKIQVINGKIRKQDVSALYYNILKWYGRVYMDQNVISQIENDIRNNIIVYAGAAHIDYYIEYFTNTGYNILYDVFTEVYENNIDRLCVPLANFPQPFFINLTETPVLGSSQLTEVKPPTFSSPEQEFEISSPRFQRRRSRSSSTSDRHRRSGRRKKSQRR